MKQNDPCTHHALAAGQHCRVDRCDHGTVHITLGAMTLRLSPEQLADLAATLEVAAQRMDAVVENRPARLLC